MGQLTGKSWTIWCIIGTPAVVALLAACTASRGDAGDRTPSGASQATLMRAACQPQVSFLPTRVTSSA